jgi:hypothetical protein
MIDLLRKRTSEIISITLCISGLLTWFGHDFYDVTGIKQPDFPMNLLIWLIPIAKIIFSLLIAFLCYKLIQFFNKMQIIESRMQVYDAQMKYLFINNAFSSIFHARTRDRYNLNDSATQTNVFVIRNAKGENEGEVLITPEQESAILEDLIRTYEASSYIDKEMIDKIIRKFIK